MIENQTQHASAVQIEMKEVQSSQIHSIGHDPASNMLAVRFKTKDGAPSSLYHYSNVSATDFIAFDTAESIGSHFYKAIKPFAEKYPYVKIESAPAVPQE
ncbi:KTSC domain-containing protein [Pandoraea apista]|uniref:KTSC domain-containing protein n=1 Tax=Pandoraea apista TaxID=93218 RepID=A0A5E5P2U9_9BURK|nr:KTSC domain-containing protein [Pandoraea apista]OXS89583.1 KTSC domain-containing protein [Pandoraea apista]VVG70660.1 KTSC domain-containing protein [Pandoraea apista]